MSKAPHAITEDEYHQMDDDMMGFCTECREFTSGPVEPDARKYRCEACGEETVYGAEEALISGLITFTGEE